MTDIRKKLEELSPEKRALLVAKLSKKLHKPAEKTQVTDLIEPDIEHRFDPFPMLDLQQAYWIGRTTAFDMGGIPSKAYVELECKELDLPKLETSWNKLVEIHDMLRLVILEDGQQQILRETPYYNIPQLDITNIAEPDKQEKLKVVQTDMLYDSRDAADWPIFEVRATQYNNDTTHLHFCFDLLNVDAGSISILFEDLVALYFDPQKTLTPHKISYRDYVLGLLDAKKSNDYKRSKDYWLDRIDNFPSGPELPLENSPSSIERPAFTRRKIKVDAFVWSKIKESAKKHNVTLSSLLLAVFAEVLTAWSRSGHFAINIPIFNRFPLHKDVNSIVGAFTTVNLLEINFTSRESFLGRSKAVQSQLLNDIDHRYYDGVDLMREIARTRKSKDAATMPIVFTSLLEQQFDEKFSKLGNIASSLNQTAQVWMDLHVDEHNNELIIKWDSVDELFPDGMPKDMLAAYKKFLCGLAEGEDAWTTESRNFLSIAERDRLKQINSTDVSVPDETLVSLINKSISKYPDQDAIVATNRSLTYKELGKYSNRVGAKLHDLGVSRNTLVAILMEKGWEQIVATVGVLKAGAAYLPIDPEFPIKRIENLLDQGDVKVVLTQSSVKNAIDIPNNLTTLCVDSDNDWNDVSDSDIKIHHEPSDLAYVLFTSGSTGKPKGAMIEHGNVVNRMLDINSRFNVTSQDKVIALSALQHDLSVYDVFGSLLAGATIIIPEAENRTDPAHLAKLIVDHGVTVWNSVPAFLEMLVDYVENTPIQDKVLPRTLKFVILAGDWIPVKLPMRLLTLIDDVNFIASGGPTETTIWDIYNPIKAVDPNWKSIPYGKPLANSKYYILNEILQPCPTWVAGEMYIAGKGLGRGYWKDKERTDQLFITHPKTGERLYKSGDLGRFLPDGNIEFIGRADFQVKIRGYRIELGEIESALNSHKDVGDAVVVAMGESKTDKKLVAYIGQGKAETSKVNTKPDDGIIRDPIERLEFKLDRHGLRKDLDDKALIDLPHPDDDEELRETFLGRQSYRIFLEEEIPLEAFSDFMSCMRQVQFEELVIPKVMYPSGGGLYPVQTYLYIKANRIENIAAGTYYYDPDKHRLALLLKDSVIEKTIHTRNNHVLHDDSAFSIFHVAQENAIKPMYGKVTSDFFMLEAGYMGQILMEAAQKYLIGLCSVGGAKFDTVRDQFLLDDGHIYLQCFIGGKISAEQTKSFTLAEEMNKESEKASQPKQNALSVEQVRKYLMQYVPQYMVPSAFVFLDKLPLTPNGKLDRKALPDPFASTVSESEYVAPTTEIQRFIAELWQSLTGEDNIGIHDNFFALGGHSLSAVQTISKIERKTGIRISPRSMVSNTLEQIAIECGDSGIEVEDVNIKSIHAENDANAESNTENGNLFGKLKRKLLR